MRLIASVLNLVLVVSVVSVVGCGDDSETDPEPEATDASVRQDAGGNDKEDDTPVRDVPCTDQSFMLLGLFDKASSGAIRDEGKVGDDFTTAIDATGGGLSPTQSFVYARFTEDGLKKVAISDEDAFESLEWHIAFRRYVIRLNSGVSGPGEVTAGRTAPRTTFADVSEPPENVEYRTEEYFIEAGCEFVAHTSGLETPATALSSYWTYSECVQMTKNVYVLTLPDDRHVKLEVLAFYAGENQRTCDETGKVPMPSGAGNLRIRWSFI